MKKTMSSFYTKWLFETVDRLNAIFMILSAIFWAFVMPPLVVTGMVTDIYRIAITTAGVVATVGAILCPTSTTLREWLAQDYDAVKKDYIQDTFKFLEVLSVIWLGVSVILFFLAVAHWNTINFEHPVITIALTILSLAIQIFTPPEDIFY